MSSRMSTQLSDEPQVDSYERVLIVSKPEIREPPTSLCLPPTTQEDLRLDKYYDCRHARPGTIHVQTSMSPSGIELGVYSPEVSG
ncbi:hypothetical protein TNCV_189931 [Trichonephila clavipes]|nr:hypothetical protein TNCV_189931 [Trichonephila clavipes]